MVHSRDYPTSNVFDALVRSGYHVSERPCARSAEVASALQPQLIVAAISPTSPSDLQCLRDLSRACEAFILLLGPSREGMAQGLLAGADATLFDDDDPEALAAQFGAVLRRTAQQKAAAAPRALGGGGSPLAIDVAAHMAHFHGEPLHLAPMEFSILLYLAQHEGAVCYAGQILESIAGTHESDRRARELLKSHIFRLRRELRRVSPEEDLIVNVHGVGYRLVGSNG